MSPISTAPLWQGTILLPIKSVLWMAIWTTGQQQEKDPNVDPSQMAGSTPAWLPWGRIGLKLCAAKQPGKKKHGLLPTRKEPIWIILASDSTLNPASWDRLSHGIGVDDGIGPSMIIGGRPLVGDPFPLAACWAVWWAGPQNTHPNPNPTPHPRGLVFYHIAF